ncbi:MAG TPA: hypothetical protein VN961_24705, partial [Streptosporangiaceae bacterium]|nr:hypothetical protein [Streptosporangiaceae bacterium]
IVFLTTSNTDISWRAQASATWSHVAIWQAKAFAVQDATGAWQIGFKPAVLLNPAAYGEATPVNPLPNGTAPGTLRPAPAARTGADPDPTELQP